MKAFSLLCVCVLLTSCSIFGIEDGEKRFTVYPEEIVVLERTSNSIQFQVSNSCASWCTPRNGIELVSKKKGNDYVIKFYNKPDGQKVCPASCLPIQKNVSIEIPQAGEYRFQFIHRGSVEKELLFSFP
jgi:hypothetical protein